jgi:hypothetical protein
LGLSVFLIGIPAVFVNKRGSSLRFLCDRTCHEVAPMPIDKGMSDVLERWATAEAEGRVVDPAVLCATSPELLPELERLCRFHSRMNRLLSSMSSQETVGLGDTPPPRGPAAFPPVPGYAILRELDEGGMGRVYHARQTRPPGPGQGQAGPVPGAPAPADLAEVRQAGPVPAVRRWRRGDD